MTRPPLSRGSREHPLTRALHLIVLRHDSLTRLLVVHLGSMPSLRGGPHELLCVYLVLGFTKPAEIHCAELLGCLDVDLAARVPRLGGVKLMTADVQ